MPLPNPNNWTTNPEYIELLNFITERTKNVKSPLKMRQLAREFKQKSGCSQSEDCLHHRIRVLRSKIPNLKGIDVGTKIKMLFALSVPISADFLERLREHTEVSIDCHNRIILNKSSEEEGLKLGGARNVALRDVPVPKNYTDNNGMDKKIIKFLAEKATEVDSLIDDFAFVQEFQVTTGATENIHYLVERYKFLKNRIHSFKDFDVKTKVRMMMVTSAFAPNSFLGALRKNAFVEVDERNRIIKYRENDGSFELTVQSPNEQGSLTFSDNFEFPEELIEVKLEPVDEEFIFEEENHELQEPKQEESDFIVPKLEELEEDIKYGQDPKGRDSLKRTRPFSDDPEFPEELIEVKLESVDEEFTSDKALREPKQEESDFIIPKLKEPEEDIKTELFY